MTSELGTSGASMSRNMAATGRDDVLEEDRGARPHIILYSRQGLASSDYQLCSEQYQAQRIWSVTRAVEAEQRQNTLRLRLQVH